VTLDPAPDPFDPFRRARIASGLIDGNVGQDRFVMALRYADLRAVARNWRTFTSDAPFRVPIPSERGVRPVRQLPIEVDPPEHGDYRRLVGKPFSPATSATIEPDVRRIADSLLDVGLEAQELEIVRSFAVPLQSRALAAMLGRSKAEADVWTAWGTHVFRDFHDSEEGHARELDLYLEHAVDEAIAHPGDDFFGLLATAIFRGRRLTREEMLGFANLTFAGGRDTVINSIANILHYLAQHPAAFERLRSHPNQIPTAIEEFLRYFSPLTHIGRITRTRTNLLDRELDADTSVSLCFASANRDETVFEDASECVLDRDPNRHLAFGFGPHTCLGAPHARMILAVVLDVFVTRVRHLAVVEATEVWEELGSVRRLVGFDPLVLELAAA
jgi:cytochrome P450